MSKLRPGLRFRDFLQVLKKEGDLVEITEQIDPHLEAGAIMRKVYEEKLPVPLFKNLKKDPKNPDPKNLFNIAGCIGGLRGFGNDHARIAHHLGLDSQTPMKKIIDHLVHVRKYKEGIPPTVITDESVAPVKANKLSGDKIRLNSLPAPLLHKGDGGKYIQTYGMFILQTPDKSWTNWSIARAMIHDDKHLTGLVMNPQHIRQVAEEWAKVGKGNKIPYALCFGVPPAAILVSSMPIPKGMSENEYVGALLGEPVKVIKAETNDSLVPIDSEMVFEGTLDLDTLVQEGPFGEMHGYCFPGTGHASPKYTVDAITYRDDAILPVSNPGLCTDETHTLIGGLISAEAKIRLMEHPLLSKLVLDVFTPYEAQAIWLAVSINTKELVKQNMTGKELSELIGNYIYSSKVGFCIQEIVLVGDDIDIFNWRKLFWAYATRHTPGDDQYFFHDKKGFALCPFMNLGPRNVDFMGGNVVTNCILPPQFKDPNFTFVTCDFEGYDEETKEQVLAKWDRLGF